MASAREVSADEDFSKERLLSFLQTCVSNSGDISMDICIAGIDELLKFLTRFGDDNLEFILPEIMLNLSLLKEYRESDAGDDYATVRSMIDYEFRHNLVQKEDKPSGTHTLLKFHCTMEFIYSCLIKVQNPAISDDDFPGEIVKAYTETLGSLHPQLMVASIQWALPTFVLSRTSLMETAGFAEDSSEFWAWLKQVTDNLKKLNNAIETVYENYQLLNLLQETVL